MTGTILITGGAGFIGSNFVHFLWNRYDNLKIIVLDLLTYAGSVDNFPVRPDEQNERFEFWYGDVRNASLVESLVARCDYVVHFAAETHVTRSIFDNKNFFETDVLGTQAVANAVLKSKSKVKRFVHISTSEVYGTALGCEPMDENHPLNPASPYAAAKAGADRLVYSYVNTYDIPAVIVRPFNNFGPRQHLEKAIPRFITSCILGEPLTVHGMGRASRDWVWVDDTCRAVEALLSAPSEKVVGETFNVGSERTISIGDIAIKVAQKMGVSQEMINFLPERPGQVDCHLAECSKMRNVLGWRPQVAFDDGLEMVIDWYKNNRELWEKQIWLRQVPIVLKDGTRAVH